MRKYDIRCFDCLQNDLKGDTVALFISDPSNLFCTECGEDLDTALILQTISTWRSLLNALADDTTPVSKFDVSCFYCGEDSISLKVNDGQSLFCKECERDITSEDIEGIISPWEEFLKDTALGQEPTTNE